jgi:hypothetical protein
MEAETCKGGNRPTACAKVQRCAWAKPTRGHVGKGIWGQGEDYGGRIRKALPEKGGRGPDREKEETRKASRAESGAGSRKALRMESGVSEESERWRFACAWANGRDAVASLP